MVKIVKFKIELNMTRTHMYSILVKNIFNILNLFGKQKFNFAVTNFKYVYFFFSSRDSSCYFYFESVGTKCQML